MFFLFFGNGQTLVTRGNVAIYCYNALTAKTWDVTESTDGALTSSSRETATILEKYFSDFTNDAGKLKLVEGALVSGTPITDSSIGTSQVEINAALATFEGKSTVSGEEYYLSDFLGTKDNVKNEEEKTHGIGNTITAYVLESACGNIATLYGKTVDVIFGKDNKVAYIAVTDDAMDGLVTAWDGEEIEIDGEAYELSAEGFSISVFGIEIAAKGSNATVIDTLFNNTTNSLTIDDADRAFNRAVKTNVVLNEDNEVEKIDFMFAEDYEFTEAVKVANYIVKSISAKGKINAISTNNSNTNILGGEFEDIEEDVRVIKNNEIVSLEDIEVGDVLTLVSKYNSTLSTPAFELATVYVASERAEGEITRLKTDSYTLDGEDVYYTVNTVIGDSNGDIEEAEDVAELKTYYGEEVEFYLSFMGEVVAVVANTEAIDSTLGIVTTEASVKTDDNDVDYLSVRILTEDGKTSRYKIYNKKTSDNYDEAATYGKTFTKEALVEGAMVIFAADADNIIKSNEIEVVDGYVVDTAGTLTVVEDAEADADNEVAASDVPAIAVGSTVSVQAEYEIGSTTVVAVNLDSVTAVSNSKKEVTQASVDYKFAGATLYNNKVGDEEVIKGWSSLCNDETDKDDFIAYDGIAFVKKSDSTSRKTVVYYVAALDAYVTEEAEYAMLVDIEYTTNDDDEDVYVATLYIDGDEVEYEIDVDEVTISDFTSLEFVTFELSDDEIVDMTKLVDVYDLAKLEADDDIDGEIQTWVTDAWDDLVVAHKGFLEVEKVYDTYIEYISEYNCDVDGCSTHTYAEDLDINEDGYIIYDLRDGYEMFEGDLTEVEGLLVYGFETEVGNGCDIFVIFE